MRGKLYCTVIILIFLLGASCQQKQCEIQFWLEMESRVDHGEAEIVIRLDNKVALIDTVRYDGIADNFLVRNCKVDRGLHYITVESQRFSLIYTDSIQVLSDTAFLMSIQLKDRDLIPDSVSLLFMGVSRQSSNQ